MLLTCGRRSSKGWGDFHARVGSREQPSLGMTLGSLSQRPPHSELLELPETVTLLSPRETGDRAAVKPCCGRDTSMPAAGTGWPCGRVAVLGRREPCRSWAASVLPLPGRLPRVPLPMYLPRPSGTPAPEGLPGPQPQLDSPSVFLPLFLVCHPSPSPRCHLGAVGFSLLASALNGPVSVSHGPTPRRWLPLCRPPKSLMSLGSEHVEARG